MSYEPTEAMKGIVVEKKPTKLLIHAIPAPIYAGVPFTVSGTLATVIEPSAGITGKTIYIYYDSILLASPVTGFGGGFSAEVTIPTEGTYRLTVEFREDAEYLGVSITSGPIDVIPAVIPTSLTIEAPDSVLIGETFEVSGKLTRTDTGAGIAGQTINITYDTITVGSAITATDGSYSLDMSIPTAGSYTLTAKFPGTAGLAGARTTFAMAVPPELEPLAQYATYVLAAAPVLAVGGAIAYNELTKIRW